MATALLKFRNRRINTYRGVAYDELGDPSDVGALHLTGVPVAIAETTDTVFDAATMRQQIVRTITCVAPNWADIIDSDTLQDEATGFFYIVESIEARPGPGYYPPDKLLTLRMRSGVTIASDLGTRGALCGSAASTRARYGPLSVKAGRRSPPSGWGPRSARTRNGTALLTQARCGTRSRTAMTRRP